MNRIILLILLLNCFPLFSQVNDYKIYNISREEGLPTENVDHIFQDSYGFLWIVTFEGLIRWDGNSYKKYIHSQNNKNSLSNNIVYKVFEDHKKRLWIATVDGLNLYNREADSFIKCIFNKKTPNIAVNAIAQDSKNRLWLGASNGLYQFNYDEDFSEWFAPEPQNVNSLSDEVVFGLAIDKNDDLWIGTFNGGVNKFSPSTKKFTLFKSHGDAATISSNRINSVFIDVDNNIWIGTFDKGITVLDANGVVKEKYLLTSKTGGGQSNISVFYQDMEKRIWVGGIRQPLYYFDKINNKFVPFLNSAYKKPNLRCESVTSIYQDNFGNLWFGTQTEGLFYTNKNKNKFRHYSYDNPLYDGLKGKVITSFFESPNGKIWIGTSGGGLSMFDNKNNKFINYTTKDGLRSNDVHGIEMDKFGNLWVATWNGGVSRFNSSREDFTTFVHNPSDSNSLIYNNVKALLSEDTLIWVGTHGQGVAVYNIKTNQFIHKKNNKTFPFDMGEPAWINHLFKDRENRIWISTYSGVYLFDRKKLHHFSHTKEENSISNNAVNMTLEDKSGRIWILSEGGGIDLYNESTKDFNRYFNPSITSKAFVLDEKGKMWVSSNEGIYSIDLETKKSKRYDAADGLQGSSFFQKAVLKSSSGELYFGGYYGFNVFYPDSIKSIPYKVEPYFTSLQIFDKLKEPNDKDSPLKKVLQFTDTLTLSYDQAFFSIGFTTNNLYSGNKTKFSYQLKGLQDKWMQGSAERNASFTNLEPGFYTFNLRYTDVNGEWSSTVKPLIIVVNPPWYKTMWFKLLVAILSLGSVILVFYIRVASIKERNRELEEEVSKRTNDLTLANDFLLEKNQEIHDQSKKILLQQDKILSQNHQLEKSNHELEKLNTIKDRFLSVLAHDLKNPISAVAGIAETLRESLDRLDRKELSLYLNTIENTSKGVYGLLINLLNWGAAHSKNLEHSPTDFAIFDIIKKNALLMEQQMNQKNITLQVNVNPKHFVFADYNMIDTTVRNLLSNSIKFTFQSGTILIESLEIEKEIELSIKDDGVGMSKSQLEDLYSINKSGLTKGTAGEEGTGLGLIIVREFIVANKGSLSITSEEGVGSTFKVRLPKSVFSNEEKEESENSKPQTVEESQEEVPTEKLLKIKGKKIVLVEDNQELRDYLKLYLSSVFEIFEAKNGKEGLEIAEAIQPTAIISDITMPIMDGIEFCRQIKKSLSTSHIPFILLTSHSNEDSQMSGYNAGADIYLTKPVKKDLLFKVILNIIDNQDRMRERILDKNTFLPDDSSINKSEEEFIKKVIDIIERNISDPNFDYKTIGDEVAMSKTVLYGKIKAITGLGVQEFIKSLRLKRSLKYLFEGKLSISEVAEAVGFSSQSYFNKCFIKEYNVTPKAYMSRHRKQVGG